jgi:hypothetical protein
VAPGFAPYTAAEVGAARRQPLTATRAATRTRLIQDLRARALIGPDDDAGLPLEGQPARQIAAP